MLNWPQWMLQINYKRTVKPLAQVKENVDFTAAQSLSLLGCWLLLWWAGQTLNRTFSRIPPTRLTTAVTKPQQRAPPPSHLGHAPQPVLT